MNRNSKFLSGTILLAGALLVFSAPAHAQNRRPITKEDEPASRPAAGRKAPVPVAQPVQAAPAVAEIFFCETSTTECRSTNTSFTVNKLRDLFVFVTWPGANGDVVQTVEFFLPDGSLYLKRDTPFRARVGQPRARAAAGDNAVADAFLTSSRGVPTVVTPLAVAGTYITQRSLLGAWTVRVSLGGKPVLTGQFTLKAPEHP